MQVDGRIDPTQGELRAARTAPMAARGRSETLVRGDAPLAALERAHARDEPRGRLTVRGLEVAFDPIRDHERDLLERWREARVDAESREALERQERAREQALAAYERALADARTAEVASGAGTSVVATSDAELAAPAGLAPDAGEARAFGLEPRASADDADAGRPIDAANDRTSDVAPPETPEPPAVRGYLGLSPSDGLRVDLSA